jgi:adenosylcobyric acid synthase
MLLVCDIDRGGAFAHLYGTWALLEAADRDRVRGFVLNRFRGDPALLDPGPAELERRTGVATLGVVPMIDHGLPDEDGADPAPFGGDGRRIRWSAPRMGDSSSSTCSTLTARTFTRPRPRTPTSSSR